MTLRRQGEGFILRVVLTTVAVLALLTAPLLPHHHHMGRACMVEETCEIDHHTNDKHTHHNGDSSSCIEKEAFVVAKNLVLSSLAPVMLLDIPTAEVNVPEDVCVGYFAWPYEVETVGRTAEIGVRGLRAPPVAC